MYQATLVGTAKIGLIVELDHDNNPCKNENWERSFSKIFHNQKETFTSQNLLLPIATPENVVLYQNYQCLHSSVRLCATLTYVQCMYVFGGKKFGKFNPYIQYEKIIDAQTGKHSCSANSSWHVFPKRQRMIEENYITCTVHTAVVTVFAEARRRIGPAVNLRRVLQTWT